LRRAKELSNGGELIVGISTDEFNEIKGKKSFHPFEKRKEYVEALRYVDKVIPENNWGQKESDFRKYNVDKLVMGNDWENAPEFKEVKELGLVDVVFLPRTEKISSTHMKDIIS
jgi:glycerol-3-phosphate cytidylyltransferase